MKILLSPAKSMRIVKPQSIDTLQHPLFLDKSIRLQSLLKVLSPLELQDKMSLSYPLSLKVWEITQDWNSNPTKDQSSPAIFAFHGEVYQSIDPESLKEQQLKYLEQNLRILSGFYGLLRPLDQIMPYRLEMGRDLPGLHEKNLYEFWRKPISDQIQKELKQGEFILNLASKEYYKVLDKNLFKDQIITIDFKDFKNGELRSIMIYFKQARGLFTRWCAVHNIDSKDDLKLFKEAGYKFEQSLSKENHLVFIR